MDELAALRLQIAWGVDEILLPAPQSRRTAKAAAEEPVAVRPKLPPPPSALPAGPAEAAEIAAACTSLRDLCSALGEFSGCALRDTATHLAFADGAADARVMVIGDAPGAEEDRAGKPFAGPSGQLLDKMLASIGLDRGSVRLANIVPWRPPGDRPPTEAEIAVCLPFLHRHITLLKPDCLLLLGTVATRAMFGAQFGHASIGQLRGKWQRIEITGIAAPQPCLATYHPAYLLRMPAAKRDSWHDLLALRHWLDSDHQHS